MRLEAAVSPRHALPPVLRVAEQRPTRSAPATDVVPARARVRRLAPVPPNAGPALDQARPVGVRRTGVVAAASPRAPVRGLTPGEVALVRSVFGDSIDTSRVRIYGRKFNVFQGNGTVMAPNGNVYFPRGLYRADFSTEAGWQRRLFMHEMTHVWQHQNGVNVLVEGALLHIKHKDPYRYQLDPSKDLADYNIEQQGQIIALHFAVQSGLATLGPREQEALRAVLSRFLEDPSYQRGRVESAGRLQALVEELGLEHLTPEELRELAERTFGDHAAHWFEPHTRS